MKTRHLFGTLTMVAALATALTAQQPAPQAKNPDDKSPDSVIARIARDMQSAEQRLKKTDAGELTRKIQRDVIDGLDELIKQNEQSKDEKGQSTAQQGGLGQQQGGAGGGTSRNKGAAQEKQGGAEGQEGQQDQPAQGKGGKGEAQAAKDKDQGKDQAGAEGKVEGAAKEDGKKDGDKSDAKGTAKGNQQGKDPSPQGGAGRAKNDKSLKPKSNINAETYREDWGHLPPAKRMEMDAYSKEKFMQRYDEILQQYYRTVAEYGRGKEK